MSEDEQEETFYTLPIEWHFPEDVKSRYANNFIVQHTEHEFYLTFFDVPPPILLGTPEERKAQLEQIKSARAEAVARVVIAPDSMPTFIQVLQENLQKYQAKLKSKEDSEK